MWRVAIGKGVLLHVLMVKPQSPELRNFYFQPLEVVSRYRDPQLQVTGNLGYLRNLSPNIYQCFKIENIFYFYQMVIQVLIKHRTATLVFNSSMNLRVIETCMKRPVFTG